MVAQNRGSEVLFWVPTLKEAVPPPLPGFPNIQYDSGSCPLYQCLLHFTKLIKGGATRKWCRLHGVIEVFFYIVTMTGKSDTDFLIMASAYFQQLTIQRSSINSILWQHSDHPQMCSLMGVLPTIFLPTVTIPTTPLFT